MRVFINPGHAPDGQPDPGAVNLRFGLRECDLAAEISEFCGKALVRACCEVLLYQRDDLADIVRYAKAWRADVFVSVHCNASDYVKARGTETYFYPGELKDKLLAEQIQHQIIKSLPVVDRGVKTNKGFYVLRNTAMPAVLVETAFISNDNDAMLLKEYSYFFGAAIARGITDYWQLTEYQNF